MRFLCAIVFVSAVAAQNTTVWQLSNLIPATYSPLTRPSAVPIVVNVSIYIVQILSILETTQTIQLDMVFNMTWQDTRLNFPPSTQLPLPLDASYKTKIYFPDVYFRNAQSSSTLNILNPVTYLQINNDTSITYSNRMQATFSCPMNLFRFPQDNQICYVEATSLTLPSSVMQINWNSFSLKPQQNSKFYLRNVDSTNLTSDSGHAVIQGRIRMFRKLGYYVLTIYAPSFLLVVTCFVGFWIPILGWPARVAVVVTPLMSIIVMQTGIYTSIGAPYIFAIEIWMAFCEFFSFMALCEYAFAIQWSHRVDDKKAKAAAAAAKNNNNGDLENNITFTKETFGDKVTKVTDKVLIYVWGDIDYEKAPQLRNRVDYISRLVFPPVWLLFVWLYLCVFVWPWLTYND